MNKLEIGEVIILDNGKEYICLDRIEQDNTSYVFLISNFTPLTFNVVIEVIEGDKIKLLNVKDVNKKEELLKLFVAKHNN